MSNVVNSFTMLVKFQKLEDGTIEVYTDGSFMGDFGNYRWAGEELGDEFAHRMGDDQ